MNCHRGPVRDVDGQDLEEQEHVLVARDEGEVEDLEEEGAADDAKEEGG